MFLSDSCNKFCVSLDHDDTFDDENILKILKYEMKIF